MQSRVPSPSASPRVPVPSSSTGRTLIIGPDRAYLYHRPPDPCLLGGLLCQAYALVGLHWIAIQGLAKYGYREPAKDIAKRWMNINEKVYRNTGKMMEKYNVVSTHLEAGGGEYPAQDGFGWTNGVYLALDEWMKTP